MSSRRTLGAVLAAGLVGAMVPVGPAEAGPAPATPGFGGFSASSTATPLKLEVYEPTIPIPASPQAELSLAYTKTQSATGPNAQGRASWLWPGDPVGEGWKTFVEQLGLPKRLGEGGYRVQVNSSTPGGPRSESDEPVPGTVMRTRSSARQTVAEAGYSPDGELSDRRSGAAPAGPGSPGGPVPTPGNLPASGEAITGKPGAPGRPPLPPQVAALVDADGVASVSRSVTEGDLIRSYATSKLTGLTLLSGLITADSVTVSSTATSDGRRGAAGGTARVVGLALAGNQLTVDRDGVHAAGKQAPIPGLPSDPAKALAQLGISFELPKGRRTTQGANAQSLLRGLQVVIDTRVLRSKLDGIPFDQLVDAVPDQAGQLKSLLGALAHVAPKLVVTAGGAATDVSTVPGIALPSLGGLAGPASAGGPAGSGLAGGGAGSSGVGGAPAQASGGAAPAGAAPAADVATRNAAAGLPPLGGVPGALLVGGLLFASGLGWWLHRIGAFVAGAAPSCSHGLETGVPDLRKA